MPTVRRLLALYLALVVWPAAEKAGAEVSVLADQGGKPMGTLIMYREGSPPSDVWKKIRPVDDRFVLNPQGDAWGDGFPDIAFDPLTRRPQVVWAQSTGQQNEVVFAHWDGERWTSPALVDGALAPTGLPFSRETALRLSPASGSWTPPRLALGSNRISHVVWGGTDLVPAVWYRELDLATGEIGAATMLNDPLIPTSNPAMLVALDRIFVGVEQEESGLTLVVVIQAADIDRISQRDSEPFRRRVVTMTLSVGRIGLQLFIQAGTARALWLENPDEIGYSDYLQTIDNWANAYYLTNSPSGAPAP